MKILANLLDKRLAIVIEKLVDKAKYAPCLSGISMTSVI